jgi:hypothetical protein
MLNHRTNNARVKGNRLVKATLNDTDITIQQAEFDGLGRRIRKTVTNSGICKGLDADDLRSSPSHVIQIPAPYVSNG